MMASLEPVEKALQPYAKGRSRKEIAEGAHFLVSFVKLLNEIEQEMRTQGTHESNHTS